MNELLFLFCNPFQQSCPFKNQGLRLLFEFRDFLSEILVFLVNFLNDSGVIVRNLCRHGLQLRLNLMILMSENVFFLL